MTKSAQAENFFRTNLGGGSDGYVRGTIDANYSFSDTIALRLNALTHQGDVPGRNEVYYDHVGVAPSLALGLGTPTRVDLDYYYYRTDDMPDYSIPYGRNVDNTAPEGPPVAVDRDNFYGLVDRDFQETGADIGTVVFAHDFSDALTLTNTTRYGESSNDYIVTNPDDGRGNVPNGYVLRNQQEPKFRDHHEGEPDEPRFPLRHGLRRPCMAFGAEFSNEEMYQPQLPG